MSMIIAQSPKTYFGAGDIQKSLGSLPGFPWSKYPGEKHLPGHNYTGPDMRLDRRLDENDNPKPAEEPVNRVDAAALKHDILYRNKDVTFRHQADKHMIDELENIPNPTFKEKLLRALIIKLLKAKLKLGKIILMKDNFQEIKRSRVGRGGTDLLKKINDYEGDNCYIPTDGHCFIKCVNRVLNEDYTREFQEYINGFSKANRKGVMTCARMKEFNKKFNTSFQIYNPKNRHFHPRDVHDELDWVFYLHNSHFCLIRRSQKSLGIQEIENNYEQVWKTCRDDYAVTQVSPLKLNVLSSMSDDALFAWDCETYSEKDTRRAIPYACTLINLEKLRKMLNRINNLFPDLKSSDPLPEEFYDKLMNVVEIFIGTDCIDQMLKYLEYSASKKDKTEVHSRLKKIECTKLMAFDANGLYASAMSDLDSEYPRAESGRPFLPEEEKEFVKLFNKQKFRPRTAILTVWFDYPKNMFFQPIPAKDKITFTNKEGKRKRVTKSGSEMVSVTTF
ncbi:hypothetical protein LOTGIDRAFT_170829 [Lottia gigantea]|uniref:Phospholipase A2-like domain-containing protein n=1 Tax=Lottia gigantea TaxID=225164 RepID=V4BAE1_LOTGI|nr:hypothetical protein LOTGIDRAFT_170829 [Lottia gigantea]ESP04436.1 hypothetical protein LOTGIDRAFT_170829 [Lottia gigantea]